MIYVEPSPKHIRYKELNTACAPVAAVIRDRPRRSTATMVADPFTLVVALDESGKAEGDLYLDDGHSFAFTKGAYLHRRYVPY